MKSRILAILLFVSSFVIAQVPNTETFSLDTVRKVLGLPANSDLSTCFSTAVKGNFDPLYDSIGYAPVRSLKRFRNYTSVACVCETVITVGTNDDDVFGYLGIGNTFGDINPDCSNIKGLMWGVEKSVLTLILTSNYPCCEITVEIDGVEYVLIYDDNDSDGHYYTLETLNPFPDLGEYCNVKICNNFECECLDNCCYGQLYNWYAVNTGKLAPIGWHIPTESEYNTLSVYLGGDDVSGGKMKSQSCCWGCPNTGATNISGFKALPGGFRAASGEYYAIKTLFISWTSTNSTVIGSAHHVYFDNQSAILTQGSYGKNSGLSVRCILDGVDPADPGSVMDIDGNTYTTVKIGTQVWMVENLKVTHYNDGELIPTVTDNSAWAALTTGAKCAYNNDQTNVGCGE